MAVNETIVTGRKFRKCIDAATKAWQRISFWTKSSDVEFEDGKNAETKLGAIDGITDSLEDTSSRLAASAKAVSTLNNNLGGYSFGETADGKPGYRKPGADTVIPFKSGTTIVASNLTWNILTNGSTQTKNIDVTSVPNYQSLTADNFFMNIKHIKHGTTDGSTSFSKSYNSTTGILTLLAPTTKDSWYPQGLPARSNTFQFDIVCF